MRICLVSDFLVGYHKNWSGAELVVKILADSLKKENQEILYITTSFGKNTSQKEVFQLPTFINNPRLLKKITAPFYLIIGAITSFYFLWRTKPDIVHLLHTNYLFIPVMMAARLLKIPTVFTFLDYYLICSRAALKLADGKICDELEGWNCRKCISFLRLLERFIMKFLSQKLDGVITFTETSKKRLIRHGFPAGKIRIIYTYNIPKEFSSKAKEVKDKNILFIGTFHEHKGLRIIIKAMAEVLKEIPEAKLNVVGLGLDFDVREINKLVDNLKIRKNVNFLGQKSNKEVLDLILENNLVVVAEQWPSEFGPLSLVEAMALGRPVVSGSLGSQPDFIQDGFNGFLVDYNQPEQFAKKIIWLLKNKTETKLMGQRAKQAGGILFDRSQGKKHIEFYNYLIK